MASEEITNETAEQPVEAATPAPVAETPAAAVSAPEEIKKPEPRKDIFAELGLGGDDDKPKILKAKGSKNVSTGVVHVSSTFNNTVVTVTDQRGNVTPPQPIPRVRRATCRGAPSTGAHGVRALQRIFHAPAHQHARCP